MKDKRSKTQQKEVSNANTAQVSQLSNPSQFSRRQSPCERTGDPFCLSGAQRCGVSGRPGALQLSCGTQRAPGEHHQGKTRCPWKDSRLISSFGSRDPPLK